MAKTVKPVPEGYHSITPHLVIKDAEKAIDFYKKAFNAEEQYRMLGPGGKIMHAELKIGDSLFMLADECDPHPGHENCSVSPETLKGTSISIFLYAPDADDVFERAKKAGASVIMAMQEMFWGDRVGQVRDPFGHLWSIAVHTKDLTREQIEAGAGKFYGRK